MFVDPSLHFRPQFLHFFHQTVHLSLHSKQIHRNFGHGGFAEVQIQGHSPGAPIRIHLFFSTVSSNACVLRASLSQAILPVPCSVQHAGVSSFARMSPWIDRPSPMTRPGTSHEHRFLRVWVSSPGQPGVGGTTRGRISIPWCCSFRQPGSIDRTIGASRSPPRRHPWPPCSHRCDVVCDGGGWRRGQRSHPLTTLGSGKG